MEGPGGIVNVYKPENITSFGVVMAMRRIFQTRKVGHIGTLDPFAKGVLPVCIGRATGVARYMDGYDKRYRVVISFGERTDTQDSTGVVIARNYPSGADLERIRDNDFAQLRTALEELKGESMQLTPMFSARKINGTPLYKLARKGVEVQREKRKIYIYSADLIEASAFNGEFCATVDIHCTKGTYIRTICDDIGLKLSYYAHAKELTRLSSGPFLIEDTVSMEDVENNPDPVHAFGKVRGFYEADHALVNMPCRILSDDEARRIIQGQTMTFSDLDNAEKCSVYSEKGIWLGVIRLLNENESEYRAERIFADADRF